MLISFILNVFVTLASSYKSHQSINLASLSPYKHLQPRVAFHTFNASSATEIIHSRLRSSIKMVKVEFLHGIASGDPLATSIILWTKITADVPAPTKIIVIVARDKRLEDIAFKSFVITDKSTDFTIKIEATGLLPKTKYYYRFFSTTGDKSMIGITKTLPDENDDQVNSLRLGYPYYRPHFV